jgi:WD40 repeat protein
MKNKTWASLKNQNGKRISQVVSAVISNALEGLFGGIQSNLKNLTLSKVSHLFHFSFGALLFLTFTVFPFKISFAQTSPEKATESKSTSLEERNYELFGQRKKQIFSNQQNGLQLYLALGHSSLIKDTAWSPDGTRIATASDDQTARVWDAVSGKELAKLVGHTELVNSSAWSPDGTRIVTASDDQTARVWDAVSGKELAKLVGHTYRMLSAAWSPNGTRLVTTSDDKTARVWDAMSGKELAKFVGRTQFVTSQAWSPDGTRIITASWSVAKVWDAETYKELAKLVGRERVVKSAVWSPDGTKIVTVTKDGAALVWDASGMVLSRLVGHKNTIFSAAWSPDGKRIVTGSADKTAIVWDSVSGKELLRLVGHSDWVWSVGWAPDGARIVTASGYVTKSQDKTARVWDAVSGKELTKLVGHEGGVFSAAWSPDGKRIVTASKDGTARVWEAVSGKELIKFERDGEFDPLYYVAWSPDGTRIVSGNHPILVRDVVSGKVVTRLFGNQGLVFSAAWSQDGTRIVTSNFNQTAAIWDANNGELLVPLVGHLGFVRSASFHPSGKFAMTSSEDGIVRFWDAKTGDELCSLAVFNDGGWAVVDPEGRFDGSDFDVDGIYWVYNGVPIDLAQYRYLYSERGLLAKKLGFNQEPLLKVVRLTGSSVKLFPVINFKSPEKGKTETAITLTNQGGGIGRVIVKINGKEINADARAGNTIDPKAKQATLKVNLDSGFVIPGQENRIEVVAYNGDNTLPSRGFEVLWKPDGQADPNPPELYVLCIGSSEYANPDLRLKFAAKDARDMAQALGLGGRKLFNTDAVDRVHVRLLTTDEADLANRPTKDNIRKAFEDLLKARKQDVVVVYLAGHGVTLGENQYGYLTCDTQNASPTAAATDSVRERWFVTGEEISAWLLKVPAVKQVVALDTCAAGAAAAKLVAQREVSRDQALAIERMKDRAGLHILMGSAADAVSYEASQYGQGLLTYSLLQALKGGKLRDGEFADVRSWFDFAADEVPKLARGLGGIQRPLVSSPKGVTFDIGRFTGPERDQVPLARLKPVILRPRMENFETEVDDLDFEKALRGIFARESLTSRGGVAVYVDSDDFPGAITPRGRYTVSGDVVTVTFTLIRDKKKVGQPIVVTCRKSDISNCPKVFFEAISEAVSQLPLESSTK